MPYLCKQQITLGWHDADLSLNCTDHTHLSLYLSAFTVEHHVRVYAQSYAWNQGERSAHEILILLNISTAVAASIIRCDARRFFIIANQGTDGMATNDGCHVTFSSFYV